MHLGWEIIFFVELLRIFLLSAALSMEFVFVLHIKAPDWADQRQLLRVKTTGQDRTGEM